MGTPADALVKFWDELRAKARVEIDHPELPDEIKATAEAGRAKNDGIRTSLREANEVALQLRTELEAERRAHVGAAARLQDLQAQLSQTREQQQRLHEGLT